MDPEESPWADSAEQAAQTTQSTDEPASQASSKPSLAPSTATTTRGPRTPRRLVAQPTQLSAADDPLGPLGGASSSSDKESGPPPAPPQKEVVIRTTMGGQQQQQQQQQGRSGPRDPADAAEAEAMEGGRAPPPVMEAVPTGRSGGAPSVSVEDAAKVSFSITVGDPHKVGDLTSSHIVYSVRTRVSWLAATPPSPYTLLHRASLGTR